MAKVEWRAGEEDIGLLVLEDLSPGHEISNNYGPRNNEQCECGIDERHAQFIEMMNLVLTMSQCW